MSTKLTVMTRGSIAKSIHISGEVIYSIKSTIYLRDRFIPPTIVTTREFLEADEHGNILGHRVSSYEPLTSPEIELSKIIQLEKAHMNDVENKVLGR